MATTVVFEGHPAKIDGNPFDVVSAFGVVQTISVGDVCAQETILREALEEIADGGQGQIAMQEIAQAALDAIDAMTVAEFKEAKAEQARAALSNSERTDG